MFKTAAGSALVIALALGSFPLVQAASLNGSVSNETAAALDAVNSASSANVSGQAAGTVSGSGAGVSGSGTLDTSVSTDTNLTNTVSNLTSGATVNSEADLSAYTQALLSSERSGGSAAVSGQTNTSANVSGDAQGAATASGSVKGAYVSDVAYADDGMTISFRQPARFLGFILASVEVDAEVTNSGEVTLHYPWYSFLMSTHRAEIMAAIEARVASIMNGMDLDGAASGDIALNASSTAATEVAGAASASADTSASGALSPRARAQILDEVRAVVHEIQADGSLAANAAGTVNGR